VVVFTRSPGAVKQVVEIVLERPRIRSMTGFATLRDHLSNLIRTEIGEQQCR
jgi:hypothetical protein